ncbi:TA system antitoxin ParD family protein [Undibacterium sp. WLHG33]|jgi:hypothetical protein|uniref:TA system antitoxin ParD family protein n=1 Tax=Undibacterium sp. WLHG33 TaxID=3412482 RepID=UPI003C304FF6
MGVVVKLSDELISLAQPYATVGHRSIPKQIEYWARLGKAAEDNPDLPVAFIRDVMLSEAEANAGQLTDYKFGV